MSKAPAAIRILLLLLAAWLVPGHAMLEEIPPAASGAASRTLSPPAASPAHCHCLSRSEGISSTPIQRGAQQPALPLAGPPTSQAATLDAPRRLSSRAVRPWARSAAPHATGVGLRLFA